MNDYGGLIIREPDDKTSAPANEKSILKKVQEQIAKRKSFSYNGKPVELSSE
jgi:hypothetical protein